MGRNGGIRGKVNNPTPSSQIGRYGLTDVFESSQNLVWPGSGYTISYLAIGGGGGSSGGVNSVNFGAGAAAGVARAANIRTGAGYSYTIVVGAGGTGGVNGTNGGNTTITGSSLTVTAVGGDGSPAPAQNGSVNLDYTGSPGGWVSFGAGGGAGAGAPGAPNGVGGAGYTWPINQTTYGGGGGGGPNAAGGTGGGGAGSGASGTTNTGSGGGGGAAGGPYGNGGSGLVIIAYPGTDQRAQGGTVSVANNVVYHRFTGPGTFIA